MKQFLLSALLLSFVSCSDELTELDGKWQLLSIESDGNVEVVDTVFYNIQSSFFQYQIYQQATDDYLVDYGFKYRPDEDHLTLELQTESFLPKTDWTSLTRDFKIEKHTSKKLILSSEGKTYTFRNF